MQSDEAAWARRRHFAECAVLLQGYPDVAGAASLYDEALANALAAIVAREWPGEEMRGGGKMKSARELIRVVQRRAPLVERGTYSWKLTEHGSTITVTVATRLLEEGLDKTQGSRHARLLRGGGLEQVHVDALVALDEHPALQSLDDERFDERWRREMHSDREAMARAEAYIAALSEEEWARREEPSFTDGYGPWDPKERSMWTSPEVCPVCGLETLMVSEPDRFAMGIGAGTCIACGYTRTPFVSEELAQRAEIQRLVEKEG